MYPLSELALIQRREKCYTLFLSLYKDIYFPSSKNLTDSEVSIAVLEILEKNNFKYGEYESYLRE